jgi:hypothetical protein
VAKLLPRYPIYVPSKGRYSGDGRYSGCMTAKFLTRDGVPFSLVVEPHEADEYRARYGDARILTLPFRE